MTARQVSTALAVGLLCAATRSEAYRPFVGTDADTAALGEFELEIGPGYLVQQGTRYVETPSTVLNLGVVPNTELVIDFTPQVQLGTAGGRLQLADDDLFIKHTFRLGTLQGKSGVGVAAEGGVLTPELSNGRRTGWGASVDVIASYRWAWTTVHFNEQAQYARDGHVDLFSGVILEGPQTRVRPVAELYLEKEFQIYETASALLGALWTVSDSLVIDAGVRACRYNGTAGGELRAGLTWTIPVWSKGDDPP